MNLENNTTTATETQEVTPTSPDNYTAVEEAIVSARAEVSEKMAAGNMDEVIASANKVKELEAEKIALLRQAQEGAMAEDTERTVATNAEKMKELAHEEAIAEDAKRTELATIEARKVDDAKRAEELLAEIQGGGAIGEVVAEVTPVEQSQEATAQAQEAARLKQELQTPEGIYGMKTVDLEALIKSNGFGEEFTAGDPDFKEKYSKMRQLDLEFNRTEVKLFDRVLSGDATEEEIKIAVDHAAKRAEGSIRGFNSNIPKAWYTNERIAEAIAGVRPDNRIWVNNVKENYSNEELKKERREIREDGTVTTYIYK